MRSGRRNWRVEVSNSGIRQRSYGTEDAAFDAAFALADEWGPVLVIKLNQYSVWQVSEMNMHVISTEDHEDGFTVKVRQWDRQRERMTK